MCRHILWSVQFCMVYSELQPDFEGFRERSVMDRRRSTTVATVMSLVGLVVCQFSCVSRDDALVLACGTGKLEIVKLLLGSGAHPDARNPNGDTALGAASLMGYTDVARLLLDRGANVDARSGYGDTPLIVAAGSGHTDLVQLLLDRGADVNAVAHDVTALSLAVFGGELKIVKLLVENGGDIQRRDQNGDTLLTLAAKKGQTRIERFLRAKGAKE